jgi:hypothetical protein
MEGGRSAELAEQSATSTSVRLPDRGGKGGVHEPATFNLHPATPLAVWIAHGENDEIFSASDARAVGEWLRERGAIVELNVFPGRGHGFGEDQPLLVRRAAEFCARELGAPTVEPDNVRPSRWYYWLPAGVLALGFGAWSLGRGPGLGRPITDVMPEGKWSGLTSAATKGLAGLAVTGATLLTAVHLILPWCRVTPETIALARRWCVRAELRADFDWLCARPEAKGCRLGALLEHLNLGALQRAQFAGSLAESEWREFGLSPWLGGVADGSGWRGELWEWLAPRVRREQDAEAAAQIVNRWLALRISISEAASPVSPAVAWARGTTNPEGFRQLLVAALRSVGVAARFDPAGRVEFWHGDRWQEVPVSEI